MPTSNMVLTLPTVSVTVGPTFATQINAALTTIDAHDHTSGKGLRVPSAGITIDANLSANGYVLTSLKAVAFSVQASSPTTACAWVSTAGDLWFTNSSNTAVRITNASTLNAGSLVTSIYTQLAVAGDITIAAADAYTHYKIDTSGARAITLPLASAVSAGRFYVFSDANNGGFAFTLTRAGADTIEGGSTYSVSRAYGSATLISDGVSKWAVVTEHAATTTRAGAITLAGDLGGTAAAPTVIGLTGTSGVVSFGTSVVSPTIKQADTQSAGQTLTIASQTSTSGNNAGGNLTLTSGDGAGTGAPGTVAMQLGTGFPLVTAAGFDASNRRVVVLCGAAVATNIPTGNDVVWLSNCTTVPSSNPVGGGVLYAEAGALKWRGSGGTTTTIAAA